MPNPQGNLILSVTLLLLSRGIILSSSTAQTLPKLDQPLLTQTDVVQETEAEIIAEITQGPGNITITPSGRIIISLHQFYQTEDRVVEVAPDGSLIPFPNLEWTRGRNPDGTGLDTVLGIQSDANGVVWMLDNGMRGQVTPQLVAWDTRTNSLTEVIPLPPPVSESNSFLNDLAVSDEAIYIADTTVGGTPALIVVDLNTRKARRVLIGHQSVVPEDIDLIVDGTPVQILQPDGNLIRPRVGVNPITLDSNQEWLYFGPMHGTRLYRIRTQDLLNTQLSEAQLAQKVEDYAERPISDGIIIDRSNNIYITDVGANAIGVIGSDRTYQVLLSAPWISWPDAFSIGPDGYIYSLINQLHRTPPLNAGIDKTVPPFLLIRFKPR
ncbi:L-dopachrome tautomerase-related protein [Gloeocapsa sp. PCC 73106]|uniref:L-dopachrome tautomerase-related protein n=1 Tax=Gloeocapsa sp. PCC 73106 TaxID=102232 RepID=UPI0002ACBEF9|nr:L-dopachrome tautomerase-related protein [Gloeocapsa sp. PCC 73106]ELR96785.1 Major royal jelly protein [Gloeocapsa sp. PCC 73106]